MTPLVLSSDDIFRMSTLDLEKYLKSRRGKCMTSTEVLVRRALDERRHPIPSPFDDFIGKLLLRALEILKEIR